MKILPLSEAKAKLSALVDDVRATDEEVVITKNGRAAAVLVSPDEYEGWKETIAIHGDEISRPGSRRSRPGRLRSTPWRSF